MIGTTLSHYKIVSELGRGGMGIVYKAEDTKLDRTVALKILPATALTSDEDRARFHREAKSAAALNHQHIAAIHEIDEAVPKGGSSEQPRPFIAMEFIDGQTLEDHIKEGPLTLEEAVRITSQVALALEAAHEKDIIHRDIKAANVMLTAKGEAKVLDFGLAKTRHSTMLTRMGSTLGTISYMSPEQARGDNVDHRTDIWALGVLFYELICGRLPFGGDYEQAVTYSIMNEDPQPLTAIRTGVPMSLDWIVGKLLAKKADERYQSASDLLVDLKTVDLTQMGLSRTTSQTNVSVDQPGAVSSKTEQRRIKEYLPYALLAIGLLAGVGLTRILSPAQNPPPVRHLQKTLEGYSVSRWPVLSESGRYFVVGGAGQMQTQPSLSVFDLENNTSVTIPNSLYSGWPSFSKDESRIAFISDGTLKIANLIGGDPIAVAPATNEPPIWADDGSLYFLSPSTQMNVVLPSGQVESFMPADSAIVNIFTGSLTPDGKTMFVTKNEVEGKVATLAMDMDTGRMKRILEANGWMSRYVESGHLIVQTGPNGQLVAYPFSMEDLEITGLAEPIFQTVTVWDWSVTESGHLSAYANRQGNLLEMTELTGDGQIRTLIAEQMDFEEFQFSPSGDQIISEINGYQNGVDQLLLFELDSGNSRQISFGEQFFEPSLSPDGRELVFSSILNGSQNIGHMRIDGRCGVTWLTRSDINSGDPDWSPSGEFVVYDEASLESGFDIWKYSLGDSTAVRLVEESGGQMYPRVSPDSRFVVYQSDQTRQTQVFVHDMETGTRQIVTREGGYRPAWGPEGESIYYRLRNDLMVVDVSTDDGFTLDGQETLVTSVGSDFYFDVSDNGRIAIAKRSGESSVLVDIVLNWSSALEGGTN